MSLVNHFVFCLVNTFERDLLVYLIYAKLNQFDQYNYSNTVTVYIEDLVQCSIYNILDMKELKHDQNGSTCIVELNKGLSLKSDKNLCLTVYFIEIICYALKQ